MPDSNLTQPVYPDSNFSGGAYGGSYSSHPAIEAAGAHAIDQLTGVGVGFTILLIVVGFLGFANYLQFRRNNSLVDQMFNIVPNATTAVLQAVSDFKQAIKDMNAKG